MSEQSICFFHLPLMVKSTNWYTRHDRRRYNDHKKDMVFLVAQVCKHMVKIEQPVNIEIHPKVGKGIQRFDCSNYSLGLKMIEDGLVKCGVLQDDSPECVRKATIHAPERVKDKSEEGFYVLLETAD